MRCTAACLLVGTILLAVSLAPAAKKNDPDAAKIVTSDLDNFVKASVRAAALATPAEKEQVFQSEYLDKASPGLRDFLRLRIKSVQDLVRVVRARPKYYASLESAVPKVAEMEPEIRKSFRELATLYPEAIFPDVYIVIGAMSSGGTTSDSGLLIGLDMYGKTPDTDMSEMNAWAKAVLGPLDGLPGIVAHELMHEQQAREGKTLLARACREGFADFVGELVSGKNINRHLRAYGDAHEGALWREFKAEMDGHDVSRWLYQGDGSKDRPADLGYYIGYRIAASYYDRAPAKSQAVRDILTVRDYPAFLKASGYEEKLTASP